ncbi:hypothetical protein QOZ80_7AG0571530 [Eleusine coracana subsp. coracana]|nr:hypothetical protein QOZ80_7AG0571530 [Eleusine coracana subsp. coracana]
MAGRRRHGRHRSEDRLSDLPDELLHKILIRLPSTFEAARTSVLSRRWRHVWTNVPALSFSSRHSSSSILNAIDAALEANAFPTLGRLSISINWNQGDPAARAASWLRFASQRLVGELILTFTAPWTTMFHFHPFLSPSEIAVPVCERATAIHLQLKLQQRLRFPTDGSFTALGILRICCFSVHVGELERLLSMQCPRLQELVLSVSVLNNALSIRSESLQRLRLGGGGSSTTGHITVNAPRLARLEMSRSSVWIQKRKEVYAVHIVAPELTELICHDAYSQCDHIVTNQPCLRKLEVNMNKEALVSGKTSTVLEQFDTVDELELHLTHREEQAYEAFMVNTAKLLQCKSLKITFQAFGPQGHAESPSCHFMHGDEPEELPYGDLATNGVALDTLEEVEFSFLKVGNHEMGLMRLLLTRCGAAVLTRVVVHRTHGSQNNPSLISRTTCKTITNFCHPETRIEFYGYSRGSYELVWTHNMV